MPSDIQVQIERRRQRAREEITKIVNKGHHPVFSLFEVKSVSGLSYRVEIRSLDEMQNSCTCPDYKTNLIGTCKHIESVLTGPNQVRFVIRTGRSATGAGARKTTWCANLSAFRYGCARAGQPAAS